MTLLVVLDPTSGTTPPWRDFQRHRHHHHGCAVRTVHVHISYESTRRARSATPPWQGFQRHRPWTTTAPSAVPQDQSAGAVPLSQCPVTGGWMSESETSVEWHRYGGDWVVTCSCHDVTWACHEELTGWVTGWSEGNAPWRKRVDWGDWKSIVLDCFYWQPPLLKDCCHDYGYYSAMAFDCCGRCYRGFEDDEMTIPPRARPRPRPREREKKVLVRVSGLSAFVLALRLCGRWGSHPLYPLYP